MAGLDPTQAGALSAAVNAADLQFLETALTLDASSGALQIKVAAGDILAARVLPPQGGSDYIEVAGQAVAAQLPTQVYPGDVLALQVTRISGNQIFVRNLGTADPESLPPQPQAQSIPQSAAQQQPAPRQAQTQAPASPPPAPPRAVFVAASVVRTQPPAQTAAQNAANVKAPPPELDARIAAQQTSSRAVVPSPPPVAAAALRAPFVPPVVTSRTTIARTVSDVLRSVKLPDTPFTRTVAAIAQQAPVRLAPVLRRLETALAQLSSDPRAATIRTIAAFVSKLNLANTETLAAQIEAYVSHAVRGGEPKLTALLQALGDAQETVPRTVAQQTQPVQTHDAAEKTPHFSRQPAQTQHAAAGNAAQPLRGAAAHARAAVLAEASTHDLKTAMLALLRDAPGGRTGTLAQAINESLVTIAGNQLNTLNASAQTPGTIAFALPAFFHEGGKPAYLRISRDNEGSRAPMDADNFHIAFVLDTANLGTVAIDVQTSGRAVNVDVKTEAAPAATAFRDEFGTLRERLEHLRYRVSSTNAGQVQSKPAAAQARLAVRPSAAGATSGLDAQA